MQSKKTYKIIIILLAITVFVLSFFSLFIGYDGVNISTDNNIIKLRIIRVILAVIAGSSLAISGASLQGIFNNHLADPHLLGISAAAALGACVNIAFLNYNFMFNIVFALIGSLIILIIIFYIIHKYNTKIVTQLLIIGFIVNSFCSSIISVLKIALTPQKSQNILFWLTGQINIVSNLHLIISIIVFIIGVCILLKYKSELEIISFGEEEAYLLGINSPYVIKITIFANCLLISNVVIFAGVIGFIGLVIPNLIRLFGYFDLRLLLPLSALSGGLCLMFFDSISRLSFYFFSTEIPTGSLCSLLLSPIFIWLFLRMNNVSNY